MEMSILIRLQTINEANYERCLALKATVANANFVDTVTYSLAEAYVFYHDMKPFAIYEDDTMIGFVSMYVGEKNYQIINFFIDDAVQKQGFGIKAAKVCIHFLQKEYNAVRVSCPVDLHNKDAQAFWKKLGFQFSDTVENGYVFMRFMIPEDKNSSF